MDSQENNAGRPALKTERMRTYPPLNLPRGYLRVGALLVVLWVGLCVAMKWRLATEGQEMPDFVLDMGRGVIWITMGLLFAFSPHTLWKIKRYERKRDLEDSAHAQWMIDEAQQTFALEIQGIGLGMHGTTLGDLWTSMSPGIHAAAVAPTPPKDDYSLRDWLYPLRRTAFRGAAAQAVTFWPIPTFVVGSLRAEEQQVSAAWTINEARNAAMLGQHLFVTTHSERGNQVQTMIQHLFRFMDEQPRVPQTLMVSDEEAVSAPARSQVRANTCALLLGRADRAAALASSAIETPKGEAFMGTALGKLWTFFWNTDTAYAADCLKTRDAQHDATATIPRTMPAGYWQERLAELPRVGDYGGTGSFVPSPWLPVRWARFQVQTFEAAPLLGYLHRPVTVATLPEEGETAAGMHNIALLKDGWINALNSLPAGERPVRVFHDSSRHPAAKATLMRALSEPGHEGRGLGLTHPDEAFDIGQLIGDTGIGSTLLLISLATAASHESGGISAVVYIGDDHSTTFQMIRPPTAARKQKNQQNEAPANPFSTRTESALQ